MTEQKQKRNKYVPLAGVSLAGGALIIGVLFLPGEAKAATPTGADLFTGCVSKKEYVKVRQGMTKKRVQSRLWKARGIVTYRAESPTGTKTKTIAYRACNKAGRWLNPGVGAEWQKRPGGRWRLAEASGIFPPAYVLGTAWEWSA